MVVRQLEIQPQFCSFTAMLVSVGDFKISNEKKEERREEDHSLKLLGGPWYQETDTLAPDLVFQPCQ